LNIVIGEWFRMPRVGDDAFRKLVKDAGLKYDRSHGFQITSETDVGMVVSILKGELNEDVEVSLKCFLCDQTVECRECTYSDICDLSKVSQACICRVCRAAEEAPALYAIRFTEHSSRHDRAI